MDKSKPRKANVKSENTTVYLRELSPEGLETIRKKMSEQPDALIDLKAHPMAGNLFMLLCEPDIIRNLGVDRLICAVEAVFPSQILKEEWLNRYVDVLLRILDAARNRTPCERAAQYEKYLRDVLVPTLRESSHSSDVLDDLETLEDIYKVTVCLFRYYRQKEEKFIFHADRESMDKVNQSIQNVKGVGNQVLGIVFVSVRPEDRQYAIFLSWILEERLVESENQEARI